MPTLPDDWAMCPKSANAGRTSPVILDAVAMIRVPFRVSGLRLEPRESCELPLGSLLRFTFLWLDQ